MASRDFLGGFGGEKARARPEIAGSAAGGESDEIELSLGLSLGGRFGPDQARDAKRPRLERSSSIASVCSLPGGHLDPAPAAPLPLLRTSSLPTVTEEEQWRRREMQSRRRLEARRKRLERRGSMGSSAKPGLEDGPEVPVYSGLQLRRSLPSKGSSSASLPEQGSNGDRAIQPTDASSPSTAINPSSDNAIRKNSLPPTTATGKLPNSTTIKQPPLRTLGSLTMRMNSMGDIRNSMVEDMPMVSSKVEGPNSRRIDGFLYRYRKGEDVRIVCVCHGNFLTPAEFVKHAGGGDVTNPLRHIVVNPSPSVLL